MQMMMKRKQPIQQDDAVTIGGGSAAINVDTIDASKLGMKQGQLAPAGILVQKLQMPEPQRMADQPAMGKAAPDAVLVADVGVESRPPQAAPRKRQQVAQIEGEMPVSEKKQARKLKY